MGFDSFGIHTHRGASGLSHSSKLDAHSKVEILARSAELGLIVR